MNIYYRHVVCFAFFTISMMLGACKPSPAVKDLGQAQKIDLKAVALGQPITHDSTLLSFINWSVDEPDFRWSEGKSSSVKFKIAADALKATKLSITGASLGPQEMTIILNGQQIHAGRCSGNVETISLALPTDSLKSGVNLLTFELPDARKPGTADQRVLGFALHNLKID